MSFSILQCLWAHADEHTDDQENELVAFRIVALAYLSDVVFDPIKADALLTRIHPLRGKKIYYDAREALKYIKRGRPEEDWGYPSSATRRYGRVDAAFIAEWRALVE
jgi:hypothetical protein